MPVDDLEDLVPEVVVVAVLQELWVVAIILGLVGERQTVTVMVPVVEEAGVVGEVEGKVLLEKVELLELAVVVEVPVVVEEGQGLLELGVVLELVVEVVELGVVDLQGSWRWWSWRW